MTDDFDIDGEHMAPLDNDSVPNANQAHHCFSCNSPITGLYCASCGQKNDNFRRSIFSLVVETLSSLTAFESRIWRTWAALLLRPGKVAREYADGARAKWSSPVRVYLAMSLLLFGFLSVFQINIVSLDVNVRPVAGATAPAAELPVEQLKTDFKVHFFERKSLYDARMESRDFTLIERKLRSGDGFSIDINTDEAEEAVSEALNEITEQMAEQDGAVRAATEGETAATSATEGAETPTSDAPPADETAPPSPPSEFTMNRNGEIVDLSDLQDLGLMFLRNPATLNDAFHRYLPRLLFFMMPITMLIGAMFIRGRGNALLYDHLVHASYIHAVTYLMLFFAIAISQIWSGLNLAKWLFIGLLIYLPLSAKGMFGRGWVKTIWASYGIGFIYAFIIMMGIVGLVAYQFDQQLEVIRTRNGL